MAIKRKNTTVETTASALSCLPRTHKSQQTVPIRRKPMANLSFSIQFPGFGKNDINFGFAVNKRYGAESPRPMKRKTVKIIHPGWLKAKPRAVPRNGAEHGVARSTARIPSKKAPIKPSFCASLSIFSAEGGDISKRSKRERPKTYTTRAREKTK